MYHSIPTESVRFFIPILHHSVACWAARWLTWIKEEDGNDYVCVCMCLGERLCGSDGGPIHCMSVPNFFSPDSISNRRSTIHNHHRSSHIKRKKTSVPLFRIILKDNLWQKRISEDKLLLLTWIMSRNMLTKTNLDSISHDTWNGNGNGDGNNR